MAAKKTAPVQSKTDTGFDFEASLAKLESLVTRMETGDMTLEESLKAFEEGVKLTRLCQQTLGAAQQKVQILMEQQSTGSSLTGQGKVSLKEMIFDDNDSEDD